MARPVQQFVDYLAAEPIRVSAILRLPLIGLIAVLVWIWEVDHWLPGLYAVILGVYVVAAALLPVFFLLPISVSFQDRPALTAIIGTVTALGYLAVWIFYSERDDRSDCRTWCTRTSASCSGWPSR